MPPLFSPDGTVAEDGNHQAETLAAQYQSVFTAGPSAYGIDAVSVDLAKLDVISVTPAELQSVCVREREIEKIRT